jgi:hypothetical protein
MFTQVGAQQTTEHINSAKGGRVEVSQITVPALSLEGNLVEAFTLLLVTEGLSGGVVTLKDTCSRGDRRSLVISTGTTLDRALDSVVSIDGKSQWRAQDGVINLLPARSMPDLLSVKISHFEWDKTAEAEAVLESLIELPEVTQSTKGLSLKPAMAEGGASAICIRDCDLHKKPAPVLAEENDATLLSILNRIVAAHPQTIWSYSEFRCKGEHQFELALAAK